MALAYVQSVSTRGNNVTSATTGGITSTTGSLLVFGVGIYITPANFTGVSDSNGNTWALDVGPETNSEGYVATRLYSNNAGTRGAANTFTASASSADYFGIGVAEFTGQDASALDKTAVGHTTSQAQTCTTASTGTLTQADEVAVAYFSDDASSFTGSVTTAGFTNIVNLAANVGLGVDMAYNVVSATTALTATNDNGGGVARQAGVMATYKAAGAAADIAFDAASNSGTQVAQSTYTFARTITGADTFLAVDATILSAGATVTSIIDNYDVTPVNLLKIGAQATVTSLGEVECWGLAGAVTGTKNVQVNLSGSITSAAVAASYTGVHQTSPTEAFNSAQATNVGAADAAVNITTVADNCWVHGACVVNDDAVTPSQTSRNNVSFAAVGSGVNEDNNAAKTPAGAVTMAVTNIAGLKTWAIGGYAIRPVAAAALPSASVTGTSVVTGSGASLTANPASVAGSAVVTGRGAALAGAPFSIVGAATVTGSGSALASGNASSAGVSVVTGDSASLAAGDAYAAGSATVAGVGGSLASGAAYVAGTSTVIMEGDSIQGAGATIYGGRAERKRLEDEAEQDFEDLMDVLAVALPIIEGNETRH